MNNNLVKVFWLLIFSFLVRNSYAQEQFIPLGNNPVIKEYLLLKKNVAARVAAIGDTVTLPFVDDFSRQGIYPFDSLWIDSNAFINQTFCEKPISIGVATLDGINKYGNPYDPLSSVDAVADYLTSRPIFLGNFLGDTTVWLSFFYQPAGLGDEPETPDSLGLEFRNINGNWDHIWSIPGHEDTAFERVNFNIDSSVYMYDGFQFRLYNVATINGNRDHWNIDYVIINSNTAADDSIRDNALVNPQESLMSEYSAMPYPHYKALSSPVNAMVSSVNDSIHDINYGPTSYTPVISVFDAVGTQLYTNQPGIFSSSFSNSYVPITYSMNSFSYPVTSADSTHFPVKIFFSQSGSQSNANNDTSYYDQQFQNYYAYDDGTAEIGYGVSGNTDVKFAYRFDVKKQDTLRGIQIYFNQVGPVVHNKLFQLAYWDQVNQSANTDHLVYKMIDQKPANIDSINGFATYIFDTILVVPQGTGYFGFIQNDPATLYGIGLDRNTDAHANMFYHVDGYWYQSQAKGAWMMRPIFGDTINTVSVAELPSRGVPFQLYPVPATGQLTLMFEPGGHDHYSYSIYDLVGKELKTGNAVSGNAIPLSSFVPGIYFIRVKNEESNAFSVQKFIIR